MSNKASKKKTPGAKKTRRGLELFEANPFVGSAVVNTKQGVKRITGKDGSSMLMVNGGTGEVVGPAGFWHAQEVDKTQFVKLYVNGVKALKGLTGAGTKVFEQLYQEIQQQIGKDKVYLSYSAIDHDVAPMSIATYTRGMRELMDKGFIAPSTVQGWYYINPDYMWNGDRLAFVKEFRKAVEKPTRRAVGSEDRDPNTADMFDQEA